MDIQTALLAVLCLIVGLLLARRLPGRHSAELGSVRDEIRAVTERVSNQGAFLGGRLDGIDSRMSESQSSSLRLSESVFTSLGDLQRATDTVAAQARDLNSFTDIFKAPKARGGLGEALLEELLRQVLPPQAYSMQHRFASGTVVDAVVRAGGRIVCIDAKFPLANYQRMCDATDDTERRRAERAFAADVDAHLRAISTRYVVPDEGTFDFAVMYVPSEGVYAELLRLAYRKRSLLELAVEARVMPMSPLTI